MALTLGFSLIKENGSIVGYSDGYAWDWSPSAGVTNTYTSIFYYDISLNLTSIEYYLSEDGGSDVLQSQTTMSRDQGVLTEHAEWYDSSNADIVTSSYT